MIAVTLYTRAGCSLCDKVKYSLAMLQRSYPHQLQEVDITQDENLLQKYRHTIPVVRVGKTELAAPITAVQLENALQIVLSS